MRELRNRRYHQGELEDVFTDDYAPGNKREAAMWLLLAIHEEQPILVKNIAEVHGYEEELTVWPAEDLRWLLADPREDRNARAAAQVVLSRRGKMGPRPDRLAWVHRKSSIDRAYERVMKSTAGSMGGRRDTL
ncbi:MAG: hypothetical protein AAF086_02540 [Planctomycetota bacterium]